MYKPEKAASSLDLFTRFVTIATSKKGFYKNGRTLPTKHDGVRSSITFRAVNTPGTDTASRLTPAQNCERARATLPSGVIYEPTFSGPSFLYELIAVGHSDN